MRILRQFLVLQAFMLWQGGFVFYAAVVVPAGTGIHGAHGQGLVTQRVTDWLNVFGLAWHLLYGWDIFASEHFPLRKSLWYFSFVLLAFLTAVHRHLDRLIVANKVHVDDFHQMHAVYLIASTALWLLALVHLVLMLCDWAWNNRAAAESRRV